MTTLGVCVYIFILFCFKVCETLPISTSAGQNHSEQESEGTDPPPAPGRLFVGLLFSLCVYYLVRFVVAIFCVLFICVVGFFGLFLV